MQLKKVCVCRLSYLWAESSLLVEVAMHKITILSRSYFTPATRIRLLGRDQCTKLLFKHSDYVIKRWISSFFHCTIKILLMFYAVTEHLARVVNKWSRSSPSFGSDAAGPACDGAINVGEVSVIPGVEPCANLQIKTTVKVSHRITVTTV